MPRPAATLITWLLLTAVTASAAPPDPQAVLELARRNARPPAAAGGAVMELRYSISRATRDTEAESLAEHRRLSTSDGRWRWDVGPVERGEIRISDGRRLWVGLPVSGVDSAHGLLAQALDVATLLRLQQHERIVRAKRVRVSGALRVELRLEGAASGKRQLLLRPRTGDLMELRDSCSSAPQWTAYSNWRDLGGVRVPGRVSVVWADGSAVATLQEPQVLNALPPGTLSAPDGAAAGRSAVACETWTAPVARPGPRLGDLLWDHAPRISKIGHTPWVVRNAQDRKYGDVVAGTTDRSSGLPYDGNYEAGGMFSHVERRPVRDPPSARQRWSAPARASSSAGGSDRREDSTSQAALGDHERPPKKRQAAAWRALGFVSADGELSLQRTLWGPGFDRALTISNLEHHLAFEPARCDGEPVATWHVFELAWPLRK